MSTTLDLTSKLHANHCGLDVFEGISTVHGNPAVVFSTINALLSPVSIIGNTLVLAAIWRNRTLRAPSYILLAGLALTDFATGIITQPLYITYLLSGYTTNMTVHCIASTASDIARRYFSSITMENITLLAIERWLHVSRRSLLNIRRVCVIYVILLIIPLPPIVLRLFLPSAQTLHGFWDPIVSGTFSLVCFIGTFFAYIKVYRIIRHQKRQIQAKQSNGTQSFGRPVFNLTKYKKSVNTIFYVLALFLLCFLPHVICISVLVLFKTFTETSSVLFHATVTVLFASASLNPILYCWRIKEIRDEVKLFLKKIILKE